MTTTVVSRNGGFVMHWSAIFGGAVVTLGLWLLLHTLGLAAGLTAIDPDEQGSLRAIGIGTGIWSVIAPLLALFAGGYVAARTAGLIDRPVGVIHGGVVWSLTLLTAAVLLMMMIASTLRAGFAVASAGMGALRAMPGSMEDLGVNSHEVLGPANQRLQQQGQPQVTPAQLESATRDVIAQAARNRRIDRATLTTSLTRNLGMTQAEAEQAAARIETAANQRFEEARQGALTAADRTGKALWGLFLAMLLGLAAAIGGALLGTRRGAVTLEEPSPAPRRQVPVESHG